MKDFVERLIANYKEAQQLCGKRGETNEVGVEIIFPYTSGIHVFLGIDKIAEELGLEIQYEFRGEDDYTYEAFISYEGVKLFQLVHAKGDFSK